LTAGVVRAKIFAPKPGSDMAAPHILLVNPLIHDFAAYDFWARPLGLSIVGGVLRRAGFSLDFLDCTTSFDSSLPPKLRPKRKADGSGKFVRTPLPRPSFLPDIPRRFSRYGLPPEILRELLAARQRPDAVLLTSMMTYWYGGVRETSELLRDQWPSVPIVLGGVYATLCADHARENLPVDAVVAGPVESNLGVLEELLGAPIPASFTPVEPVYEQDAAGGVAALLTSRGCPFACPYCGVRTLHPQFIKHDPAWVERLVRHAAVELGIKHFAVYDDALLIDAARAEDILMRIAHIDADIQLHAASGLSCRGLTPAVARAMKAAGFATVRVGLETADAAAQIALGGKVSTDEFDAAVENLLAAGFAKKRIGVYIMAGMPGQSRDEVERTVDRVLAWSLQPHLSEYSPVPHSAMFAAGVAVSPYDLSEPLFHNPTLLSCAEGDLDYTAVGEIKGRIRDFFQNTMPG